MADKNWKSRVGIEINVTSDSSDAEEDDESRGLSVPTTPKKLSISSYTYDDIPSYSPSSPLDTHFDLDPDLGQFIDLGQTPPRTRIARSLKDKSSRHSSGGSSKGVNARSRRRNTTPVGFPGDDVEHPESPSHEASDGRHRRKRSMKLLRESERDLKLDLADSDSLGGSISLAGVLTTVMDNLEDRAESMPNPAVKIETSNRFMSLASRLVKSVRETEKETMPCPEQVAECQRSRIDFHEGFSLLIKMGNPEKQDKNCRRQLSKEETLWQSEFKDLIWLELQAWLADRTPTQQDLYLCESRKNIAALLTEIAAFKFNPRAGGVGRESVDSGVGGLDPGNFSCTCLSMFCSSCRACQNTALEQVEDLLGRLETAEALYPSSEAMATEHAVYRSQPFTAKLQALCLWYNLTRLLRLKVCIIGKLLRQLRTHRGGSSSSRGTPSWPHLEENGLRPATVPETPEVNTEPRVFKVDRNPQVHFKLTELETTDCLIASASPSDSNSSTGSAPYLDAPPGLATTSMDSVFSCHNSQTGVSSDSSPATCCAESNIPHLRDGTGEESPCGPSPYRAYVEDVLKTRGLKKAMQYLDKLHHHLLRKARLSLDKPSAPLPKAPTDSAGRTLYDEEWELRRYGYWSPEAQSMALPSYRSAFLFLSRISLDLLHEYMRLRLEQKPSEPSALSIRQLMREMKEGLCVGVKQRQRYVHLMRSAIWGATQDVVDRLEQDVADFDRSMKAILEVYLEYLQQWVLMVQKESVLVCPYQKTLLEEEWSFVKATCPYIPGGEALAANSFCRVASGMLTAIVDHLNSGVDGLTSQLDDSSVQEEEFSPKQAMLLACRGIQSVFHEARERALRAVAFAKTLRKDLEIATSFSLLAPLEEFLLKLYQAGHVRVVAPHSCSHLMFVPASLQHRPDLVCRLVNMNLTCSETSSSEMDKYLVLARCEDEGASMTFWPGETISIQPTAETTITLSHVEVQGVLLVVCDPSQLSKHRIHLVKVLEDTVELVQESLPSNYIVADSLAELKSTAVKLRDCVTCSIQAVERRCDPRDMNDLDEMDRSALTSRSREILHQCYKFGFEYNKEVCRLITGEAKTKLARGMIEFAKLWMNFVRERCERGRGLRPRWANQGLDFLMTACEPDRTRHLTDDEFEELKAQMDACISHVIGSADKSPRNSFVEARSRGSSPSPLARKPYRSSRSLSDYQGPRQEQPLRSLSSQATMSGSELVKSQSTPSTPELLDSPLPRRKMESVPNGLDISDGVVVETLRVPSKFTAGWCERVRDSVSRLEKAQDKKLQEDELIGSVTALHTPDRVHIKARAVTFSWQRGIKIGQGRFGKVYTAVNNATGELMAMKEISFQPNDHKAIRSVAEELHIFEGIQHKHLVRYYGVEIHREEMLIFMEYCEEGTLDNLVAATIVGLPEQLVRSYTRQLLLAVCTLHEHGIVHRDIKSANIFLTDEGNCLKLGDFGSAVKIKAHTTVPGELQGFVGTQAYMAPEVFMKSNTEGHGRAADIWSVGCVVVEMASGKRPWFEYDSNYQIMFKVGMGEVPSSPDTLSEEGVQFLDLCLQHDPRRRASADELIEQPFVKVELDDDQFSSIPFAASGHKGERLALRRGSLEKSAPAYR